MHFCYLKYSGKLDVTHPPFPIIANYAASWKKRGLFGALVDNTSPDQPRLGLIRVFAVPSRDQQILYVEYTRPIDTLIRLFGCRGWSRPLLFACTLAGGGGGGGVGNLGVILVRVCEPVFQNLPHSYTWSLKKTDPFIYLIIQNVDLFIYCPLIFLYPFFAGC